MQRQESEGVLVVSIGMRRPLLHMGGVAPRKHSYPHFTLHTNGQLITNADEAKNTLVHRSILEVARNCRVSVHDGGGGGGGSGDGEIIHEF